MTNLLYQTIDTRSGAVGYVKLGAGEPMILIVGYSGTLFHWNRLFIHELAQNHTVYLVDNRNIGLSHSTNIDSARGLADDVNDFIDALDIDKPWVLGWSMGGTVTQELACANQKKLRGLILMATVPSNYYVNMDFMMFMATAGMYTKDEFRKKLYYFFFSKDIDLSENDYVKANALNFSNYNYRFTQHAKDFQDALIVMWGGISETQLQGITIPVLMLWAENDLVVTKDAQKFMLDNISNAFLLEYNNGGHFLIHNDPVRVAGDIIQFSKQHALNK